MKGRGYGYGPGNCFSSEAQTAFGGEVDQAEEAKAIVESRMRNPNLKVGEIRETGRDFEVDIVTKDGSLANKLYVEKSSGRIFPAYR